MTKVIQFSNFATDLNNFKSHAQLPSRFNTSYQKFIQSLPSSKPSPSPKELCDTFAKKYHVNLPSDDYFNEHVITYTAIFRNIFPTLMVESQSYGFQIKNCKNNAFEVQWNLIGDFIKKAPFSLTNKLLDIFSKNLDFDANSIEIKALLDAGTKITPQIAQHALRCGDPRFFELLTSYGYQPTSDDLESLCKIQNHEKQAIKTKASIDVAVEIPSDTF